MIDGHGKLVAPIGADSISTFQNYLIWHGNKLIKINDYRALNIGFTLIYDLDGHMVFKEDGHVENIFPGGFTFSHVDISSRRKYEFLYDSELKRITDENMRIYYKIPNHIVVKELDRWSQEKGYTIYTTSTFKPVATFNSKRYRTISQNLWVFLYGTKYGYLNLDSGEVNLTDYTGCSLWNNSFINENRVILFTQINKSALAISKDGNVESGKVVGDMNYGGLIFLSKNGDRGLVINGLECDDAVPIPEEIDMYSVKIDNKWGVYQSYHKEMIIPVVLPAPVNKIFRYSYVFIKGSGLFSSSGELVFSWENDNIADVEDDLVYIGNSWNPQGVYSIPLCKWILPCNKYESIDRMSGGNFAAKVQNTIFVISPTGRVLNTLHNVSKISNVDGEYFIRVIGSNGKMGIINSKNGQWIAKCLYEDDIAWGAGKDQNRRFAIEKKTESGELVVVMTVGGKTVASKFFPYGSSRAAIRNFGRKYLFQSFR